MTKGPIEGEQQETRGNTESNDDSIQERSAQFSSRASSSTSILNPDGCKEANEIGNASSSNTRILSEEGEINRISGSNGSSGWNPVIVLTILGLVVTGIGVLATVLIFVFGDNIIERAQQISTSSSDQRQDVEQPNFQPSYSFERPEFIHPRIVNDLVGWVSDGGNQIISINLDDSQDSNRYHGDISIEFESNNSHPPWIYWRENDSERQSRSVRPLFNGYKFIGSTREGIQVIHFKTRDGGVMVRNYVIFTKLEIDRIFIYSHTGLTNDEKIGIQPRYRISEILTIVGMIGLGDRWDGSIAISGDEVFVAGRSIFQRCKEGGISEYDSFEFYFIDGIECKTSPPESAPQVFSYKIPRL